MPVFVTLESRNNLEYITEHVQCGDSGAKRKNFHFFEWILHGIFYMVRISLKSMFLPRFRGCFWPLKTSFFLQQKPSFTMKTIMNKNMIHKWLYFKNNIQKKQQKNTQKKHFFIFFIKLFYHVKSMMKKKWLF